MQELKHDSSGHPEPTEYSLDQWNLDYNQALEYLKDGQLTQALELAQSTAPRALSLPEITKVAHLQAHTLLGQIFKQLENREEALKSFIAARDLLIQPWAFGGDNRDAIAGLNEIIADLLIKSNKPQAAFDQYFAALKMIKECSPPSPKRVEYLLMMGALKEEMGQVEESATLLKDAFVLSGTVSPKQRRELARGFFEAGKRSVEFHKFPTAEHLLRESYLLLEGENRAYFELRHAVTCLLVNVLLLQGKDQEALDLVSASTCRIDQASFLSPERSNEMKVDLAESLHYGGRALEGADIATRVAVSEASKTVDGANPKLLPKYLAAGRACFQVSRFKNAQDFLNLAKGCRISNFSPEYIEVLLLSSSLLAAQGDFTKSKNAINQAIKIANLHETYPDQQSDRVRAHIANCHLSIIMDQPNDAQTSLDALLEIVDKSPSKKLRQTVSIQIRDIQGSLFQSQNDFANAMVCFEQNLDECRKEPVLSTSTLMIKALQSMSSCRLCLNQPSEADKLLSEALALCERRFNYPTQIHISVLRDKARALEMLGDHSAATPFSRKAESIYSEIRFMNEEFFKDDVSG